MSATRRTTGISDCSENCHFSGPKVSLRLRHLQRAIPKFLQGRTPHIGTLEDSQRQMSESNPNMPGYQVIQQPLTPSTSTQGSREPEDKPLSARILEEIEHSTRFYGFAYRTTVDLENANTELHLQVKNKEQENTHLHRQLNDKTTTIESWRAWQELINKSEVQEYHERQSQLQAQIATLQGQLHSSVARNANFTEEKQAAIQDKQNLAALHAAEVVQIHQQHGERLQDAEATIVGLASDAVKLRDGFAILSTQADSLRGSKECAQKDRDGAVCERNRAVDAETVLKNKLDQERKSHRVDLRAKEEVIDELKLLNAHTEAMIAEKQGTIEGLEQVIRDSENRLDKSQRKECVSAAAVQEAKHEVNRAQKALNAAVTVRKQAEDVATAKEKELKYAMKEILTLKQQLGKAETLTDEGKTKAQQAGELLARVCKQRKEALGEIAALKLQIKKLQIRIDDQTTKILQTDKTLARERTQRREAGEKFDKFWSEHRKHYLPPSTKSDEEPPIKKQRTGKEEGARNALD